MVEGGDEGEEEEENEHPSMYMEEEDAFGDALVPDRPEPAQAIDEDKEKSVSMDGVEKDLQHKKGHQEEAGNCT